MIWVICSLMTGATATTKSASTLITTNSTSSTERPRRMPRFMNHSTVGLRPIARNIAITSRISTEEMLSSCWLRNTAMIAPKAPKKPMLKGEWRSSDGAPDAGATGRSAYAAARPSPVTRSVALSMRSARVAEESAESRASSAATPARWAAASARSASWPA